MNTRAETASWLPEPRSWAIVVAVIAAGLFANWAIATGLLAFLLLQMVWPLDFLLAYLVVVAGASFVTGGAVGGLTIQLGMLTGAILIMLVCYLLSSREGWFTLVNTPLTFPLLAYLTLSLVNSARGVLAGYSLRFLGLELLPILALGSALLVANAFDAGRDLRAAVVGLIVIAFALVIRGFYIFATVHLHTVLAYAMATPGIVGLLLINLGLRSRTRLAALGWVGLSVPLFTHQLVTFGRGLWTGCLAGLLFSFVIFGGRGRGAHQRWRRVGVVVGILVGLVVVGALLAMILLGHRDSLSEVIPRLASIASVKVGYESRSNLIRLSEYAAVIGRVLQSPWIGHGIGFAFPVKQPFSNQTTDQWWVHQTFLLILLKQGVIGLALFLWTILGAIALGVRESQRRTDSWQSAWLATMAAGTTFLAVLSLSNFPFAVVNETFLLALLWGGAMAITRRGSVSLCWSPPAGARAASSSQAWRGQPARDRST